jgi:hypothetical protein
MSTKYNKSQKVYGVLHMQKHRAHVYCDGYRAIRVYQLRCIPLQIHEP